MSAGMCERLGAHPPPSSSSSARVELGEDPGNAAHQLLNRIIRNGQVLARCGEDADAALDQGDDAKLLLHKLPAEAALVLDDHDADFRLPRCDQAARQKAGALVDRSGASVAKPVSRADAEALTLRESRKGRDAGSLRVLRTESATSSLSCRVLP